MNFLDGGPVPAWPDGLDRFDAERPYRYQREPALWGTGRGAFHLYRAQVAKDVGMPSAVILAEIQMSSQRPWLDGPAGEPGGVAIVLPA